jgi:rubrerythrin
MFDRGWEGRQVLLMNIIDREQQEWHKENKHTMLLSRNVGTDAEGRTYPEDGVPSYGFTSQLANLFKYYKSWEKYDIGITRTGLKESPYRIINASKYFEEVPSDLQEFVSTDPLTEEELAYERYNLDQLYRVTTYTKIFNRLKSKIAIIDATLGTKYLSEMEYAVEKEKETFTQLYGNSAEATEDGEVDETPKPSVVVEKAIPTSSALDDLEADTSSQPLPAAMTRTRTKVNAAPDFDVRYLKGWDKLSQEEKDSIIGITVKNEQVVDIKYKDPTWTLLRCPECSTPSPEHFSHCPACGSPF